MKEASDYASIDNDGKLVIATPPAEEAEAKLTVTISSGSATVETKDITIKIIALSSLITNDGTAEHPLTVAEAFKILNILSSGETYQSGGADKEFYIKGYVTDIGKLNGTHGLRSVYIADSATTAKDDSLQVYNLNWDESVLVKPASDENPLLVGDQLIIKGYLIDHNSTKEVDKSSTDVYPTATQWDKVERPTEPSEVPTPGEHTADLNFAANFATYAAQWSGYANKELKFSDIGTADFAGKVTLDNVIKQSGSTAKITDKPVLAAKADETAHIVVYAGGQKFTSVVFTLAKWDTSTAKKFSKIVVETSEDGEQWTEVAGTAVGDGEKNTVEIFESGDNQNNVFTYANETGATYVRLTISAIGSSRMQVGLTSISLKINVPATNG